MPTATSKRNWLSASAILVALAFSLFAFSPEKRADAAISPSPCYGNVGSSSVAGLCTGSITVGGQAVQYTFTQHVNPNGEFKIRFNGGVYNTTNTVDFILSNMPAFSSTGYLANPTNAAASMTQTTVNGTKTAYERYDSDGCSSCIFDQVMSVKYTGLAAGVYTFDFTILQNGSSGGLTAIPFYVDAGAPLNADESNVWLSVPGMDFPCADGVDNDLDFYADCADTQCVGKVGKVVTGALCQATEATCNDGFDNDGDGLIDCLDSHCNGKVGVPSPGTQKCVYQNERTVTYCTDGFDNDSDGLTDCADNTATNNNPTYACWKQTAVGCPATETSCVDGIDNDNDQSYSSAWDNNPLTGVDCQDYDCAGNAACPNKENYTVGGSNDDALCFDGLDNDLDTFKDCADPDCKGAVNPLNPNQGCYDKEFDLGQRYQFCANGFDDDGNGAMDCSDTSCKQRFGNCGPCPSREDLNWLACADGKDNDTDTLTDCRDTTNCNNKVGDTSLGAICLTEATAQTCSDGFDNDFDNKIDCADTGCAGAGKGPNGITCQPAGETTCNDGADNDGDGLIDCADPNCAANVACNVASWTQAPSCLIVPTSSGATFFTSSNPTVDATVTLSAHVNDIDKIQIHGAGAPGYKYSSVTVIIGDNTSPTAYYPYAASSPACTLTGTNAASFAFTVVPGHAVQIYNKNGPDIDSFDITLTCNTPATPAAQKTYPISLSALKKATSAPFGTIQEYGDLSFSTTLYEATPPTVNTVQAEGAIGANVYVQYGGGPTAQQRRFRGIPVDPAPSSGICRCVLDVGGTPYNSAGDCLSTPVSFTQDNASLKVRGYAEDGAGNVGVYGPYTTFNLNVTPTVTMPFALSPLISPYFKTGKMIPDRMQAEFTTGIGDTFGAVPTCAVYLYNDAGTLVNGPTGPSFTFPGVSLLNVLSCDTSLTSLPAGLADGRYFAKIRATDSDGDWVDTNKQVLYVCNTVPSSTDPEPTNGCQYADFDRDGASEGLYTAANFYSVTKMACDNCVNLSNPLQADGNANGVGDVCEPTTQYGRCEIDTDIVCKYNSFGDPSAPKCLDASDPLCCPGPSIKTDPNPGPTFGMKVNPQKCRVAWGLCSLGGQVCFSNPQCPGGPGKCQDNATSCYKDADCESVPGTPTCTGADICDNLIYPWIQTIYGNVFSKKKITAADVPPKNLHNATFCVTAKETIVNFNTDGLGGCKVQVDAAARADFPKNQNNKYLISTLGRIDLVGLRNGKYGSVQTVSGSALDSTLNSYSNRLGGRVIRVVGDATVSAHTISNDAVKGNGTIFIDGGNLTITGDIAYDTVSSVNDLRQLASLGWIVIDDGTGTKGNIYVDKSVAALAGSFFSDGADGFYSVAPPDSDSDTQLTLYGLVIAHEFHLSRSYKSLTQGAEQFIYDGRSVANPPPGFADVTKALPTLTDNPGP